MNLENQRFGKLVVIKEGDVHITKGGYKVKTWICQCDCGNVISVMQGALKSGKTKSCGCLRNEDLTGKRFGKLIVLGRSEKKGRGKFWHCKCDCGTELDVITEHLKSGHTRSCGCIRAIDITGKKFGRLIALKKTEKRDSSGNVYWLCKCDCGGEIETQGRFLRNGLVKSCGCAQIEHAKNMNRKHGKSRSRIYSIWIAMKLRCFSENDANYYKYGGRGISVCQKWIGEHGFENFYKWAIENGYDDELTIDRINVDGNYEPSNCRWTTPKEQMQNTRRSRYVNYEGKIYTISELSEKLNLTYMQTWHRFRDISIGMDDLSETKRIDRVGKRK